MRAAILVALALTVSCTPQQAQTAADVTGAAVEIAGAVCDEAGTTDKWVRFTCRVIHGAGTVLNRTRAGGSETVEIERVSEPFEVLVPADEARAFAAKHGAPK